MATKLTSEQKEVQKTEVTMLERLRNESKEKQRLKHEKVLSEQGAKKLDNALKEESAEESIITVDAELIKSAKKEATKKTLEDLSDEEITAMCGIYEVETFIDEMTVSKETLIEKLMTNEKFLSENDITV